MKHLLTLLALLLVCQQTTLAQGLYRSGDSGRNPCRGWYPTKEAENKILAKLKSVDPHSQDASDVVWDLADFYRNGSLYNKEAETWKRYVLIYNDARWTPIERLKEQSFAYGALGRAYARSHNVIAAEVAHKKSVLLARSEVGLDKDPRCAVLQDALSDQCGFYIEAKKSSDALVSYNELLGLWRKAPWAHPSDLRPKLLALGLPEKLVKAK